MPRTMLSSNASLLRGSLDLPCLLLLCLCACSSSTEQKVKLSPAPSGVNRRAQLWQIADASRAARAPTTQPAKVPTTQPAPAKEPPGDSYLLDTQNIIRLTYEKSPLVLASREEMVAAKHGLVEFKANLSRLEPYAGVNTDTSEFPAQSDSKGVTGEVVGGIEKETFEGAIVRLESGVSGSRVKFGEVEGDQDEVESGSGVVMRARVEVPFVGSQKRQDRIISQAFQESTARKAVLDYLGNYRSYVNTALSYYQTVLLYLNYIRAYERQLAQLEGFLGEPRVKREDRLRIQSTAGETEILIDQYKTYYDNYLILLLQYVGIQPDEPYTIDQERDIQSLYLKRLAEPEGRRQILQEAFLNNPRFQVLRDAIKDAQLKRSQAIVGKYDITAFLEGTQFPFGSETFDDRVGGWLIGAGITVRPNDRRVLTASRKKAEAEIREYRAEIEAEQLDLKREIAQQAHTLRSYHDSRPQILENIKKTKAEYEQRLKIYLQSEPPTLTIDNVLDALSAWIGAEFSLAANYYYIALAENKLMSATGEFYRVVGLKMVDKGDGLEVTQSDPGQSIVETKITQKQQEREKAGQNDEKKPLCLTEADRCTP